MNNLHILSEFPNFTICYKGYLIQVAKDNKVIQQATELLNSVYGKKGYGEQHQIIQNSQHVTLVVYHNQHKKHMIGTLTLHVDQGHGLLVDDLFKEEIYSYRKQDRKICELIKFAFNHKIDSKLIIASLFNIMFIYGAYIYNCTDTFIEVNPRHKRFYEAMLGFRSVGEMKQNLRVNAPAHLLHLSLSYAERQRLQFHKKEIPALYSYFFSLKEEMHLYHKIVKNNSII